MNTEISKGDYLSLPERSGINQIKVKTDKAVLVDTGDGHSSRDIWIPLSLIYVAWVKPSRGIANDPTKLVHYTENLPDWFSRQNRHLLD